jgi:DNA (cytosine-5)-methyltransferase 1
MQTVGTGDQAPRGVELVKLRGTSNSADIDQPLGTVRAGGTHHAEVYAFL